MTSKINKKEKYIYTKKDDELNRLIEKIFLIENFEERKHNILFNKNFRIYKKEYHTIKLVVDSKNDFYGLYLLNKKMELFKNSNFMRTKILSSITIKNNEIKIYGGHSLILEYLIKVKKEKNLKIINDIFKKLNIDYCSKDYFNYLCSSNFCFKNSFNKKITNNRKLIKSFLSSKYKIPTKNLQIKKLHEIIKKSTINIFKLISYSSNINKTIINFDYIKNYNSLDDLLYQLFVLNEKIDLGGLNYKQLDKKHQELTERIKIIRIKYFKNDQIKYINDIEDKNFKLLKSKKEFLEEEELLKHCLYTNDYFEKAKKKQCYILSYDNNKNKRATIEIEIINKKPIIIQARGYRNEDLISFVEKDLNNFLEKKFMNFISLQHA